MTARLAALLDFGQPEMRRFAPRRDVLSARNRTFGQESDVWPGIGRLARNRTFFQQIDPFARFERF